MSCAVDLHIHSNRSSDGDFTPSQIVRMAREKGLRAISITDHDTVAAYPEALECGEEAGLEVIPGIELTTLFDGREFHLLLPFVDWRKKVIEEIMARVAEARFREARERVSRLRDIGFDITWEEVVRESRGTPPLGVTIARILLDKAEGEIHPSLKKYFRGRNRLLAPYVFYKDYFMEGKPAYVLKKTVSLLDVLEAAPRTGGVPVLAHPGAYFQQTTTQDLQLLRKRGLQGLEVYTTYHEPEQVEFYRQAAEELNLVPTAGSDFHGRIKPHIPFGAVTNGNYGMVEELRKRREFQ